MAPELSTTLCSVAEVMASFPEGWWIIGSAAVALHGIDAGWVHDVDLLIDARLGDAVLDRLGVAPIILPPDPLFRSTMFARWDATPVPVEVMAGFQVATTGHWQPVELHTRQRIDMAKRPLFVPDRQELLGLFCAFGRTKDAPRIQALLSAGAARPAAPMR